MLDQFLLKSQVRTCSIAVLGKSWKNNSEDRKLTGDRSLGSPCPKAVFSPYHTGNLKDSEQEESHHMVTGVQEETPYCSLGTSLGKQKKVRSSSYRQFCSENTPPTIEVDRIPIALQQLATNSNSANLNKNVNKISNLLKSLTTTMPTFDGRSKKFGLFEDLFQTSLSFHNQLTDA